MRVSGISSMGKELRAALYLRVSTTDGQTTENQRLVLARVAGHRKWQIVQAYEDTGISGAKGRDKRPAFNRTLNDAVRRKYRGWLPRYRNRRDSRKQPP